MAANTLESRLASGASLEMRPSVLFIVHTDVSRPSNGTATRSRQFLEHLSRDFDIHLLYMRCRPGAPEAAVAPSLPPDLASVTAIEQQTLGYAVFDRRFFAAGAQIMASRRCDLILADFEKAGIYGALLARRFRAPLIYSTHDVEYRRFLQLGRRDLRRGLLAPYMYMVERIAVAAADLVACIAPEDLEQFARWIPRDQLVLVPGGFDASKFNPFDVSIDSPPKIVFVGNMTYQPNREAVEITSRQIIGPVLERVPQARFQFVGVHPPGFERTEPRAEFTGFVEDVSRYIKASRLVISPVVRGGGMRIKTIEALACGKAVVATDKGAEGIDPSKTSRLRVVELEAFADAVVDELLHGRAHDDADFPVLSQTYSTDAVLRRFGDRLSGVLRKAP